MVDEKFTTIPAVSTHPLSVEEIVQEVFRVERECARALQRQYLEEAARDSAGSE